MTEAEFISFVKKECEYYGVKCLLRNSKYCIYDGSALSGCFDDKSMLLICAMKKPGYLGILAHEYCHMIQWATKAPIWIKANTAGSYEAWSKHLDGEEVEMDEHFQIMRDLELDNEKRTVALIKKLSLPIDVREYTKKANAYVMLYNYMRITGRWPHPKRSPYNNQVILAAMPDKFSLDYSKIPARLFNIFQQEGV